MAQKWREMFEVVYYSRGGNTRKVAEAIADELWTQPKIFGVDTLPRCFYLSGYRMLRGVLVKEIADFIERNQLKGRKIALFTYIRFWLGKGTLDDGETNPG